MKKILTICFCFLIAVACLCSCKKDNGGPVIIDLNNDGVQDFWETPFDKEEESSRIIPENSVVIEISTLNELSVLNKTYSNGGLLPNEIEEDKEIVYVLKNNIDCEGLAINGGFDLNGASFYGNNKTISNFKLNLSHKIDEPFKHKYSCLFLNVKNIFDLNIHLGYQDQIEYTVLEPGVSNVDISSYEIIVSPIINSCKLENVQTRGYIDVVKNMGQISYKNVKDISLLYSNTFNDFIPESVGCDKVEINNCFAEGIVGITDNKISELKLAGSDENIVGGLVGRGFNCEIKDSASDLRLIANTRSSLTVGSIAGELLNSFVENCNSKINLVKISYSYVEHEIAKTCFNMIGGALGNLENSEMKNVYSEGEIQSSFDLVEYESIEEISAIGGLIGNCKQSTVSYSKSNVNIKTENLHGAIVGGFIGSENNSFIRKNIAIGNASVENCFYNYISDFSGNASASFYENCASAFDIELNNSLYNLNADNDGKESIIKIGMMFNISRFFNGVDREIKNSESDYNAIILNASRYDLSLGEATTEKIAVPSTNFMFSQSKFIINCTGESVEVDEEVVVEPFAKISYSGLFYVPNVNNKPQIHQNNYYFDKKVKVEINGESKFSNLVNSNLIKKTELTYTFNFFKNSFFNLQTDSISYDNTKDFSLENINFVFDSANRGSIYKNYGNLNVKYSNINMADYLLTDNRSFIIDQYSYVNKNTSYYGEKTFYGVYRINCSQQTAKSYLELTNNVSELNLISGLLKNVAMFTKTTDGVVENRFYAYDSLVELEKIKNDLLAENAGWAMVQESSVVGSSVKTFVEAYVISVLVNLDAQQGNLVTIDYITFKTYDNIITIDIVYPEVEESVRIDRVELTKIKYSNEFSFDNDEYIYLISLKTNI